jgi:lysophospholipase L1-like esterase
MPKHIRPLRQSHKIALVILIGRVVLCSGAAVANTSLQGGAVVIRLLIGLFVLSICTLFAVAESINGAESSTKTETILDHDWAGLEHYRLANSKTAPPLKGENRVVFFGDSITEFWKLSDYFAGMPYINRGVGGQTTSQMLIRFRPDVIALSPRTVVILGGTNDILRNHNGAILNVVRDNLSSMVELAQVHSIRVVLASLLPVNDHSNGKDGKPIRQTVKRRPEDIKILNEWIKKCANDNRLTYLDYYNVMVDKHGLLWSELSFDGLHPNKDGYKIMARLAEQAITSSLTSKR